MPTKEGVHGQHGPILKMSSELRNLPKAVLPVSGGVDLEAKQCGSSAYTLNLVEFRYQPAGGQ